MKIEHLHFFCVYQMKSYAYMYMISENSIQSLFVHINGIFIWFLQAI